MSETNERPTTADLAYGRTRDADMDHKTGRDAEAGRLDEQRTGGTRATNLNDGEQTPLLSRDRSQELAGRWQDVQAEFVDEPQKAVEDADGLVAEVIQTLATTFADPRRSLEEHWTRGSEVSTENLAQALTQYRPIS